MITKSITSGELIAGYILASRTTWCPSSTKSYVNFSIPIMANSLISLGNALMSSSSTSVGDSLNYIRPAVDIPLSGTILGTSRKWTYKYSMDIITRLRNMESSKVKE